MYRVRCPVCGEWHESEYWDELDESLEVCKGDAPDSFYLENNPDDPLGLGQARVDRREG